MSRIEAEVAGENRQVKFFHFRLFNHLGHINNKGGVTAAVAVVHGNFHYGFAVCSTEDQFSRPVGRAVALRRLQGRCAPNDLKHGVVHGTNTSTIKDVLNTIAADQLVASSSRRRHLLCGPLHTKH